MSSDVLSRPPPPPDRVIAYGSERSQFGHLRLPRLAAEGAPAPVVVVVHGGFWRVQYSLDHIGHLCAALTAQGWVTWSLEYRRLGEAGGGWPGTLLDAAAGLDHLRVLASDYPLDLERVVTIGHSAGGHLALWLAGRHRIAPESHVASPDPQPVRGGVALAAVSDLRRAAQLGLSGSVAIQLMGGRPDQVPERYDAASPSALVPLGGRVELVHGEADEIVPVSMSREYWQQATAAGDSAGLTTLAGAGHFEVIDPSSWAWPSVREAVVRVLA